MDEGRRLVDGGGAGGVEESRLLLGEWKSGEHFKTVVVGRVKFGDEMDLDFETGSAESGGEFAGDLGVGACAGQCGAPDIGQAGGGRVFDEAAVVGFDGDDDTRRREDPADLGDDAVEGHPKEGGLGEKEIDGAIAEGDTSGVGGKDVEVNVRRRVPGRAVEGDDGRAAV